MAGEEHFDAIQRGVRLFAFLFPEGAPVRPMMNQSVPAKDFATRGSNRLNDAMTWLTGAD